MAGRARKVLRWVWRWSRRLVLLGLVLLLLAGLGVGLRLRASLPKLDGTRKVAGIGGPVEIIRDNLGIPTIRAGSRADACFATGFVHAQDRLFQMDISRRFAAGELAELVGPGAVPVDRRQRLHRFRPRMTRAVAGLPADQREILEAYVLGVNAGFASLGAHPWEYDLLQVSFRPWTAEDSLLAVAAMTCQLQDDLVPRERALGAMREALPPALFAFLTPATDGFDAAIDGTESEPMPIPSAEEVDIRQWDLPRPSEGTRLPARGRAGSNNFALAGPRTTDGRAVVANDMHLGLGVPATWYRLRLEWREGGRDVAVTGASLSGVPGVVVGSNGQIAWGFTNASADTCDLVQLEMAPLPGHPPIHRVPEGWEPLETDSETIAVKGGEAVELTVWESRWGPILGRDHRGRTLAVRWLAHDPERYNLELFEFSRVEDVDAALDLAARCGMPQLNLVVGDAAGRIGWALQGPLPRRIGHDGTYPRSWADGRCGWDGTIPTDRSPRLVDPPSGQLWTANNRVIGGESGQMIGRSHYDTGARAAQIREDLTPLRGATEADLLAVQLDDRALFLGYWRKLLLDVLSDEALEGRPDRARLRREVMYWGGRVEGKTPGPVSVRLFRERVVGRLASAWTAPARAADPGFALATLDELEGPFRQVMEARPMHLLPPSSPSWEAFLLEVSDGLAKATAADGRGKTPRPTSIRHPLSGALVADPGPRGAWLLGGMIDMPPSVLAGDVANVPRIQGPGFGASQRMAVAPGREERGYFQLPGGQAGHPLSPHYRDQYDDWVEGRPTPFLPGEPTHRLVLQPA